MQTKKYQNGRIAQLVEQRIENPRVPGSIPGSATIFSFLVMFSTVILKELIELNQAWFSYSARRVPRPAAHGAKNAPCSNLIQSNLVQVRPPFFHFLSCFQL